MNRIGALITAAVLLLGSGVAAYRSTGTQAAGATKTYRDAAHHYHFSYPASWDFADTHGSIGAQARAIGIKTAVQVYSPDGLAVYGLATKPGLSTASQIKAAATALMKTNTILGSITYQHLHGLNLSASANVQVDKTHSGPEIIVIVNYRDETFYQLSWVSAKPLIPAAENTLLNSIVNSLTLE